LPSRRRTGPGSRISLRSLQMRAGSTLLVSRICSAARSSATP
jgi:hypothetical protein